MEIVKNNVSKKLSSLIALITTLSTVELDIHTTYCITAVVCIYLIIQGLIDKDK